MPRLFDGLRLFIGEDTRPRNVYEFDSKGQAYVYQLRFETWDYESFVTDWPLVEYYIGLSHVPLPYKLYALRAGRSNKTVGERLRSDDVYTESVRIIKQGSCRKQLRRVELEEIKELINDWAPYNDRLFVLNNEFSPVGFNQDKPQTPAGQFCCPVCGEIKAKSEFYKDKTRYSGISSKCKICAKKWRRIQYIAEKNGESLRDAYSQLKSRV